MSMIAQNKEQKTHYLQEMLPLLWQENAAEVVEILLQLQARNVSKQQELIAYLKKISELSLTRRKEKRLVNPLVPEQWRKQSTYW